MRLTDRFPEGSPVEIQFAADTQQRWLAGIVVAHDHPGVWVQLTQGGRYFVTNGRRIRPIESENEA